MSMRFVLMLCLSAPWFVSSSVRAQTSAVEPAGYRDTMEQALVEYDAGHFTESRALFSRAYGQYANARVMRCLGMVEFELRNYRDSASWLEQALASNVQALTAEQQGETARLLARARNFIAQLQLTLQPAEARVIIDGTPASFADRGTLSLEAGDHVLEFRASGYVSERRVLKARGGDAHTWDVTLAPEPPPVVAVAPVAMRSERERMVFAVPRLMLLMPGSGHYKIECQEPLCPDGSHNQKYDRNASAMFGVDVMYAPVPSLRVGLGAHAQLNQTTWKFDNENGSKMGRVFWLPVSAEYRIRLSSEIELPLRLFAGLALLHAGRDMKRVGDSARDSCKAYAASGVSCSVVGPPGAGMIFGVGPGIAYRIGNTVLRGDFNLGYQWLRLIDVEAHIPTDAASQRQTDRTLIAALSISVEI